MLARELRWELREVTTAWGRTDSWGLLELDTWQLEQESEAEDRARKRQQRRGDSFIFCRR